MAHTLIYTSARRLLTAGRSGFGTVARSRKISSLVVGAVERYSQFDSQRGSDRSRVILAYRKINVGNATTHLLSSIRYAGTDYTGRTNHIAHHLLLNGAEVRQLGQRGITPADILQNYEWLHSWDDAPRYFEDNDDIDVSTLASGHMRCHQGSREHWQSLTGNGVHARIIASLAPSQSAVLVFPDHVPQMPLMAESLAELDGRSWDISFTNSLESSDHLGDFTIILTPLSRLAAVEPRCSSRIILRCDNPHQLPVPDERQTSASQAASAQGSDALQVKAGNTHARSEGNEAIVSEKRAPVSTQPTSARLPASSLKHEQIAPSKRLAAKPKSRALALIIISVTLLMAGLVFWVFKGKTDNANLAEQPGQPSNQLPPEKPAQPTATISQLARVDSDIAIPEEPPSTPDQAANPPEPNTGSAQEPKTEETGAPETAEAKSPVTAEASDEAPSSPDKKTRRYVVSYEDLSSDEGIDLGIDIDGDQIEKLHVDGKSYDYDKSEQTFNKYTTTAARIAKPDSQKIQIKITKDDTNPGTLRVIKLELAETVFEFALYGSDSSEDSADRGPLWDSHPCTLDDENDDLVLKGQLADQLEKLMKPHHEVKAEVFIENKNRQFRFNAEDSSWRSRNFYAYQPDFVINPSDVKDDEEKIWLGRRYYINHFTNKRASWQRLFQLDATKFKAKDAQDLAELTGLLLGQLEEGKKPKSKDSKEFNKCVKALKNDWDALNEEIKKKEKQKDFSICSSLLGIILDFRHDQILVRKGLLGEFDQVQSKFRPREALKRLRDNLVDSKDYSGGKQKTYEPVARTNLFEVVKDVTKDMKSSPWDAFLKEKGKAIGALKLNSGIDDKDLIKFVDYLLEESSKEKHEAGKEQNREKLHQALKEVTQVKVFTPDGTNLLFIGTITPKEKP